MGTPVSDTDHKSAKTVVGDSKHRWAGSRIAKNLTSNKHHRSGKLVFLLGILLLIGAVTWLAVASSKTEELPASPTKASSELYRKAVNNSQDAQSSASQLKKYGDEATDPKEKATYKVAEAKTALIAKDYDEARDAATVAETSQPTAESAAALAYSYSALGDKQSAIKYFNLAAERSPKPDGDDARSDRSNYLSEAALLEAEQ